MGFTHLLLFSFLSFSVCNFLLVGSQETLLALLCHSCLAEFASANLLSTSMKASSSALLKQEFFKKWIKGLQIYSSMNKEMTILERKKAIKLSADAAIASARNEATCWSKALVADVEASAVNNVAARTVVEQILGRRLVEKKALVITCSKKIVRRSHVARRRKAARVVRSGAGTTAIAEKLVKSRTRVLKMLVPGGQQLDGISLIKETLDYIASIQAQVDVMRNLAAAAERIDHL